MMPLSVSFLETQGLRWLDGAPALPRYYIGVLHDVCSYYISQDESVSVAALQRQLVACQNLSITIFLSNFCNLMIPKKLNTEMRVYCTKLSIVHNYYIIKNLTYNTKQRGITHNLN